MPTLNVDLRGKVDLHLEDPVSFTHIGGRFLGVQVANAVPGQEIYIPSRDRTVTVFGPALAPSVISKLENLDSSFSGATQTRKYALLQRDMAEVHQYVLNIQGTHCGAAVLTRSTPLYCYGVVTSTGESLVFSDHDIAKVLRSRYPGSYWLFRMPVITSGVLFWSTEALCSRWYRWRREFEHNHLKCFNALELMLFDRRLEVLDD